MTVINFAFIDAPTAAASGTVEVRPLRRTVGDTSVLVTAPITVTIAAGAGTVTLDGAATVYWQFREKLTGVPTGEQVWRTYQIPASGTVAFPSASVIEIDKYSLDPLPEPGTALDAEIAARIAADLLKANAANPVFTGTVTVPDAALAIADTNGLQAALDAKAATSHTHALADVTGLVAYQAWLESNLLTTGEESVPREVVGVGLITQTSGTLRLRYFTARKTETVTQIRLLSGTTAAGATPTICRAAIFTVDGSGNLTQVGIIANDTALFATINTAYTRALTASFGKVAGTRYALGVLVVTGATAPTIVGESLAAGLVAETAIAPRIAGSVSAQTDILGSYTAGQVNAVTTSPYGVLLP